MASLEQVQAAVDEGAWQHALALLDEVAAVPGDPVRADALELRALAAYGAGDLEGALTAWEDLHAHHLARGDRPGAARAACMVALYLLIDTALMATVRGWLRRAERLVADEPEPGTVHAVVAMVRTYERFLSGDPETAAAQSALAIELGERLHVLPAVVIGRTAAGRLRILAGDVEEGMGLLDEVAAHLMSGEVDSLTTGMMFCEIICAAQGLGLHDRAREWTDVMDRWRHGAAVGGIHGRCRVHRAELLRLSGPGDLAEQEALRACAELRPYMRREFGWPLAELGTIRLHRGDLAGAEEAFLAAHEQVWSPEPGLALLRLAQGHVTVALGLIGDAVAHPASTPSKERPPFGDLRLAPLLAAQVEIAVEAGEVEVAAAAAARLDEVARAHAGTAALSASAALAVGRVALLRGETDDAIAACTAAVTAWAELGAPYETACVRLVLGEAHRRAGSEERARLEWEAARSGFGAFGARTAAAAGRAAARRPAGDDRRQRRRSRRRSRSWVAAAGSGSVASRPWCPTSRASATCTCCSRRRVASCTPSTWWAVRLEAGADPATAGDGSRFDEPGLPLIDDQARAAYRRRLVEVEEDIEDARLMDDLGRLELAERDRDYLLAELGSALGLGGRLRTSGSSAERARTSVTRSLRYALARLAEHHDELAAHLARTVRTGAYCSYQPDPVAPIVWDLTDG